MKRFLVLGIFAMFWGCAEEKSSLDLKPQYQISFSEELSLDFGEVGMSSEVPFSISPKDEKNESFLVFNTFYRRLDTVSFSPKKMRLVPGLEIPKEGPGSIPGFSEFTYTDKGIVFFTLNDIYFLKYGETVHLKISKVLDDGSEGVKAITGNGSNSVFQVAPFSGDFFTVIAVDHGTEKFSLMTYDFESFTEIPFAFDYEKLNRQKISFVFSKGVTLSNAYNPYLTLSDSMLIVSYPFMNKISTIRLDELKHTDFLPRSQLFKSQKDKPIESSEIKSFEEYYEASSKWHKDVKFGSIQRLNDRLLYRMVGAGEVKPPKLVLELFSNSFEKVGEFNLKAIHTDLKWFHITVEGKILIQSRKDTDEDIFKYYLIEVDEL